MNKILIVTADVDDGDYVTEFFPITDEEIIKIKHILSTIKLNDYRWETGEFRGKNNGPHQDYVLNNVLTDADSEFFDQFCPVGDPNFPGIHTIVKVVIANIEQTLL